MCVCAYEGRGDATLSAATVREPNQLSSSLFTSHQREKKREREGERAREKEGDGEGVNKY